MGGKDLEMVDVDAQHTAEPSLQRLKALDSLPDLKTQLKTANEFCNHGHRAEMIIRWLTTKLQKDQKTASNADSWNLLERCFRLVAPQKMGVLLARFDFLATARTSICDSQEKKRTRLLEAITKSIETLEEIAAGADGAAVKQLLSADGASTAAFLGVWIQSINDLVAGDVSSKDGPGGVVKMVLPATRLWALRKPASSDNDAFATECLVPCSLLLRHLGGSTMAGASNKRRRGTPNGGFSEADVAHDLEILIARHIFLPSRSAFFQTAEKSTSEEAESELAGKLSSINSTIATAAESRERLCEALPYLLDIALRCVPMTTSRQRSKERPWVEHVFQQLLACLDDEGKLISQGALAGMLHVVGKRASLPATTLKDLAQRYSGLSGGKKTKSVDFTLIAEIVDLDPTVFVDEAVANQLLPALTNSSGFVEASANSTEAKSLLVDGIAEPVMRAFASSRKLEQFALHWQIQLQSQDSTIWTVWTELDDVLAELLEIHMTTDQIEKLFDTLCAGFDAPKESKKSSKASKSEITAQPQRASAVILHALLKGVKSDELIGRLQTRIGNLFDTLLQLVENSRLKTIPSQVWIVLALAFKLWFPSWIVVQTDKSAISEKAQSLLSNEAVRSILKATKAGKGVGLAEVFVGLLCSRLQKYEGCQDTVSDHSLRLAQPTTETISPVFLAFPELLMILQKESRQAVIGSIITSSMAPSSSDEKSTSARQALAAFVNSAVTSSHTKLADEILTAVLESLPSTGDANTQAASEHAILDLLLQLPATVLARGQRERILDWTTKLSYESNVDEGRLTKRFATMTRLMRLPNATAGMCIDASVLWGLCPAPSASRKSKSGKDKSTKTTAPPSTDLLAILEDLAQSVCSYLLSTQDQERSRTTLKELIEITMETASNMEDINSASCERLVLIKAITEKTESGTGKDMLSHLAGDLVSPFVAFAGRVLEETQSSVKALKKSNDEMSQTKSKVLLDLLSGLRKSSVVGKDLSKQDKALVKLCNRILAKTSEDDGMIVSSARTSTLLVPAFGLLAHINGFEACTSLGEALLGSSISPKDKQLLTEELRKLAKESQASDQLAVLKKVMPDTQDASTQNILVLQNALTALTKDSLAKEEQTIHTLYLTLLTTLHRTSSFATYTAAVSTLLTILREKPFILNQHLTEATLQAIQTLARSSSAERLIYLDLCSILSALLLHHRARLQGRYHLLIATLQTLQSRLFVPTKPANDRRALHPRHARAYTRLLTLLCNPPTRTHSNKSSKTTNANDLIDSSRRARAHVGQYVPTLLHAFCAQVLSGTLGKGVRESLTPGLWAVIEAMEVRSSEAVKALSAGMNNSERAVLRSVYEDWKRFGKWEGA